MGAFVGARHAFSMVGQINARFAEGDPITEMTALHQQFSIFSATHDLKASVAVLGLAPDGSVERGKWFDFLDYLKTLDSSEPSLNGHDLIRETLQQNLEGDARPVFFQYHDGTAEPRVLVTVATPLVFSATQHLVVSVPTWSEGTAMRMAAKSRQATRAAAGSKDSKTPQGTKAPAKKAGKAKKASR